MPSKHQRWIDAIFFKSLRFKFYKQSVREFGLVDPDQFTGKSYSGGQIKKCSLWCVPLLALIGQVTIDLTMKCQNTVWHEHVGLSTGNMWYKCMRFDHTWVRILFTLRLLPYLYVTESSLLSLVIMVISCLKSGPDVNHIGNLP